MEDILRRIKELGELHKSGAISDDEFKALKKELLGSALESDITESDLSKEKHDPVKTQKETVVPHNSTTTASSSTFPVKKVILGAGLLLLLILAFKWIFPENEITQKIKETCSDCTEIEIPESDLILVTNSAGQSNIFSKSEMSYLLTEWYDIKFNEGLFFDDITFNIDGKSIMVSEHDYQLINDYYVMSQNQPTDYAEWRKIIDIHHELICECYESAINENGDINNAIEECNKKYDLGSNFSDRLSESDKKTALSYEDQLYDQRKQKIKKYLPEEKKQYYTCSICGRSIGRDGTSLWGGKCYQCYQYTKSNSSGQRKVDLTRP
jgi:hypothetical protein